MSQPDGLSFRMAFSHEESAFHFPARGIENSSGGLIP